MKLPAAEWLPDQPTLGSQGAEEIKNVYPVERGYKPIKALVEISTNAIAEVAKGYYASHAADGATLTFAADSDHLYSYSVTTFTDISRLASPYTTQDEDEFWEFVQYGDRLLATTIENAIQYYDLDLSLNFADLAGTPPRARHIAVVRDFVVIGNTVNSPSEVAWSGDNNSEQWTVGLEQSDRQTLQDGGRIQGIIGGEVGYIIQERQIVKMTYVAPPLVFQFDVLDQGYGCNSPYSICRILRRAFYRGSDGFYFLDLATGVSQPIGSEKVDRWFHDNAAKGFIKQMRGVVDPVNKLIWWSFVSNSTSGTLPDQVIGFQWELGRWFHAEFDHEMLCSAYTEAITLDEIDLSFPNLDLCPISLDSDYWLGGLTQLRGFTLNHKLALFEGDNLEAIVQTPEGEPVPGRRSMITNVRPLCDTPDAVVTIRSRERLADSLADTIHGIMESNGDVSIMSSGRYHRAEVLIPAATDWTSISGLDADFVDDGAI